MLHIVTNVYHALPTILSKSNDERCTNAVKFDETGPLRDSVFRRGLELGVTIRFWHPTEYGLFRFYATSVST